MSEKQVNLEKILFNELKKSKYGIPILDSDVYDNIKIAMKEACRQILRLAAKNAKVGFIRVTRTSDPDPIVLVDKQSIIDTITQVE